MSINAYNYTVQYAKRGLALRIATGTASSPSVAFQHRLKKSAKHAKINPMELTDTVTSKAMNIIMFAWQKLNDEEKQYCNTILVVFKSTNKNSIDKVYFLHFNEPARDAYVDTTVDSDSAAKRAFSRLREKASNKSKNFSVKASCTIVAGMTRLPGRSGSFDKWYYHPPSRLRKRIIHQQHISGNAAAHQ